jgi:hypothetical protein
MEQIPRNRPFSAYAASALLLAGMVLGVLLAVAALAGAAGKTMELAWRTTPGMAWIGGRALGALVGLFIQSGLPIVLSACALVLGATMLAVICRRRGFLRRG